MNAVQSGGPVSANLVDSKKNINIVKRYDENHETPRAKSISMSNQDEIHLKLMRLIEQNNQLSQRQLAEEMGVSLGKINYCLKAIVEKGWVKASNFKNSEHKSAYLYLLTPKGAEEKATIAKRFLERKIQEYEDIKLQIEEIKSEIK